MPNQYSRFNRTNILRKMNRAKNPVDSVVQLAREFGETTTYRRADGTTGNRAPVSFTKRVQGILSKAEYKKLAQTQYTNIMYR